MTGSPLLRLLLRIAEAQIRRPWLVILAIGLTLLPAGLSASRLGLKTSMSELLPSDKPSVIEARRVDQRLAGSSTLTVVAEGSNADSLKRFVDAVAPRIRTLGPEYVAGVDDGTREVQAFFEKNKHLYVDLDELRELHDRIISRYDYEIGKRTGFDLELVDDEDAVPPPIKGEEIEEKFEARIREAKESSPGLDGYYIGEEGKLAAILVRTPLGSGDEKAFELRSKIEQIVAEVAPQTWDPALRVNFTGNLITSAEQHRAVKEDLQHVGLYGVGLILTVVFLFFLRFRTLIAMTLTILVGCVWSFGAAQLTVGYLNTATGFLVSIIAGNGINFGIIYMARYLEARREDKLDVAEAIREAHRDTHTATLAAAGAAMIAYGSLAATDFRGFRHFGWIGGVGMILCWVATYSFLPAFLVVTERSLPMFGKDQSWRRRLKGIYGYPFAWIARKFPRTLTLLGAASGVIAVVLAVGYFKNDPMEYDLANVRNERLDPTSAGRLSVRVDKVVGRLGQDGRAILVDRLDQVKPLLAELERRRAAAPKDEKPFERVVSVYNLLPEQQDEKLQLLAEIKDRLERARKRDLVAEADWAKIQPHIPEKLAPLTIADLPELVARPFTEKDGSRGKIVYIVPTDGRSVYDAHYLMQWADSFREVKLPNGEIIRGTGDAVIFADMLINIAEDAPKAISLSLIGTMIVVLAAFRGRAAGVLALVTLFLGLSWLVAFLALRDIKLNFLNFVALPISIGVGADYALNVLKRRELESDEMLYRVFVETGGAVVLCSLTTAVGYLALLLSINRAVQSFGLAAAVGEMTTLLAAMLVLPAFLFWRAHVKRVRLLSLVEDRESLVPKKND